ncbi:hypothetical protein QQF64_000115 [Cirrhinus molitorella]|uniref:B-cell receptor CD22 first Ig-like domain-containing protein n=1 Tax=Cirrhinus molitorella TaxID=172907 RepID=A0ABR3NW86_9TELE
MHGEAPRRHKVDVCKEQWTSMIPYWISDHQSVLDQKPVKGEEHPDLSEDPEYSQRLQYLGDKQQNCTIRLSHVTKKDEHKYYFRFTTNEDKWLGKPGVSLTVTDDTDLQVESPERVTEGDSVI